MWDADKFIKARKFVGHTLAINDVVISNDHKFVISCSEDKSIKIWDILSGNIINSIKLDKSIVSMDISIDGELLATAFRGSKEINLWHNIIYMRPWGNKEQIEVKFCSDIKRGNFASREAFYKKEAIIKVLYFT